MEIQNIGTYPKLQILSLIYSIQAGFKFVDKSNIKNTSLLRRLLWLSDCRTPRKCVNITWWFSAFDNL